ncbi:MAG: oligosaccharide flippase family protein, partial [Fimbriimonadaceae bacterium]|nr:oligosaccharide flippase family protein [Fimbriimonadaceae bacterium]
QSALIQVIIGTIGAMVFFAAIPLILGSLKVEPQWRNDTQQVLVLLSFSIPFVLSAGALRGALEGAQAFGIVNLIKVPTNLTTYLVPLIGVSLGWGVPFIVLCLLVFRVANTVAYGVACLKILPNLTKTWHSRSMPIGQLFGFAGWVAVTGLLTPLLVQLDRLVIGSVVSVREITFFQTPYELINGLFVIPTAISAVVFSAASGLGDNDTESLVSLAETPLKLILATLGPLVVLSIAFAGPVMQFWQNGEFGDRSGPVLQWLALGCLIAAVSWVATSLLSAGGRPDLVAKGQLANVPIYVTALWFLTVNFGVVGAAMAFVIRVAFDGIWQFWALFRLRPMLSGPILSALGKGAVLLGGSTALVMAFALAQGVWAAGGITAVAVIFFTMAWQWLLNGRERTFVRGLLGR